MDRGLELKSCSGPTTAAAASVFKDRPPSASLSLSLPVLDNYVRGHMAAET